MFVCLSLNLDSDHEDRKKTARSKDKEDQMSQPRIVDGETFYEPGFDVDAFIDVYNTEHSFIDELSVFDGL